MITAKVNTCDHEELIKFEMVVDVEESWRINALDPTTSVMKYYPSASANIKNI